ncbi:SMI1/KNR4 family protein [Criblamydia sequanensis]|uniref:Knr4/Smi1-like domain-containing protein n=1 Tax=Candidatus Criblamydia sequanensis CRIB-18 TaxID=1437425 RepID=A0A090D0W7_9BACT|nr:SMI1/KNR4 family protein [Criblamydia sequanensis]CDR33530.1 Conserved hypothetical protein [Criblamydia sequanensis CRIB-18]
MDSHFKIFFNELSEDRDGGFHKVIALQDEPELDWKSISVLAPTIPKGWFELSKLTKAERLDLVQQYWEKKMESYPDFCNFLAKFFHEVDDIGIFLTQKTVDHPFEAQMVYSLSKTSCFFRGLPPLLETQGNQLKDSFKDIIFPQDYLSFLQIHNGFFKTTDKTGLLKAENVIKEYPKFQSYFSEDEVILTYDKEAINPKKLIPFYISFGMPFYQCFYADWYPEQEMGNVYFSLQDKIVSNLKGDTAGENLSFPTFIDWVLFYMERIVKG